MKTEKKEGEERGRGGRKREGEREEERKRVKTWSTARQNCITNRSRERSDTN